MKKIIPIVAALSMTVAGAAFAQSTSPSASPPAASPTPTSPSATSPSKATPSVAPAPAARASDMTLTDAEAKKWIGKTVYSSDGKNLGEVAALQRDSTGKVTEMHADIGGFLGIGETRVKVMPGQFKMSGDRVDINMTGEQAKSLPKLEK